jgi:hypothetical protein
MQLRLDRPGTRILGLLSGIGYAAIGIGAMTVPEELIESGYDRVYWFGFTAFVIGIIAVAASLFARDLDNIWCRHPVRWRNRPAGRATSRAQTVQPGREED